MKKKARRTPKSGGKRSNKLQVKTWSEKPARKKFVHDYAEKLREVFHLEGWEIYIDFCRYPHPKNEKVEAETSPDWRYRRATIGIYPPFWEGSEKERKNVLKHEFCHIILNQLMLIISGLEQGRMVSGDEIHSTHEHVTTWIESIVPSP